MILFLLEIIRYKEKQIKWMFSLNIKKQTHTQLI